MKSPKTKKVVRAEEFHVIAWAVVMKDDGFLPDFHHSAVGNVYHVCSDKNSADLIVRRLNKQWDSSDWVVAPATIFYSRPTKKSAGKVGKCV